MDLEHWDAIVVGSGFGGAVVAYRLAEAGRSVLLLERGKAWPPTSFPRSPRELRRNFWDPSEGLHGLFDAWTFRGFGALVASGLGGGSLIYANVLLRKDERWFVWEDPASGGVEPWPVTRAELDPHYDRVERVLGGVPYPWVEETPKTVAFRRAAADLGLAWSLPNLAVAFATAPGAVPVVGEPVVEPFPNLHARTRTTCRLCGECVIGCNHGSKNSLDFTYLTAARRAGAELRTRCEVRAFAPAAGGGWTVKYVEHLASAEGVRTPTRDLPLRALRCNVLVLAAGALGTPYLLLRNRAALPGVSDRLGERFGGNGDLLSFAARSRGPRAAILDAGRGTVITSAVRVPDALDGGLGRGYYVEDAGYPQCVGWLLQLADTATALGGLIRFVKRWGRRVLGVTPDAQFGSEISDLIGPSTFADGSVPWLGMGRSVHSGRMSLAGEYLAIELDPRPARPFFERVRATMRDLTHALGATFVDAPGWALRRDVTVHPLGGCAMGRHAGEGVIDAWGEVFGCPGLFVADGSAMPGPVGANPALTIAALADRFADRISERARGSPGARR
jgi:cholesterol oxidase